jgi:iron complex outermembrane receptor protein
MSFRIVRAIAIACLFVSSTSYAFPDGGASLRGSVIGPDSGVIVGAVVDFPDLHIGTVTDTNGRFVFASLPKGRYLVEVRYLGANTLILPVELNGAAERTFSLNTAVVEHNEVVVTGTSLATERRRSPTPIASIRLRELQQAPSSNIIDALTRVPGVSQISTGPAISKPVIRGLSGTRIITLADGVRQEGQQWGDEHGIEVDDYNVSRVEVLKGPASLNYGSDALAGVVNIITDDPVPVGTIKGNVTANYQTVNGLRALHADVGGNTGGVSWEMWGTGKEAHDYRNANDGAVFNSRFRNGNYGASIGVARRWGYSKLLYSSFNQHLGLVEGERDSASGQFVKPIEVGGRAENAVVGAADGRLYVPDVPAQRINHQKLVWNSHIHLRNGAHAALILGYQQNRRKEYSDVLEPEQAGLHLMLNTLTYDARYYFPTTAGWQFTAGVNGMSQHNENRGTEFLVPDYKLFDAGMQRRIGKPGHGCFREGYGMTTDVCGLRLCYSIAWIAGLRDGVEVTMYASERSTGSLEVCLEAQVFREPLVSS